MWHRIFVVCFKEVVDNSRDRRSLLVALIYPLLGPLILGLLFAAVIEVTSADRAHNMTLAVKNAERAPGLIRFLEDRNVRVAPGPADPESAVRDGKVQTVVVIPNDYSALFEAEQTASIVVVANSSRLAGLVALNHVAALLGKYNQEVWGGRIAARGVAIQELRPLDIKSIDVAAGTHIAEILLFMVPPLFIFNLFMGGVYLAIDTTSGERERDSLEPLLINPVERWALMLGKYLAALLFTGAAVAVQLLAFKVAFESASGGTFAFADVLTLGAIAGILVMMLPLMMVAVGVQFIIATVTRSFKEAQTYLGLLPLVPAIPGMVLVFTPVQATAWMMTIPAFSQTLLLGSLVRGEALPMADVALSMTSSLVAALALIAVSARLYEREKLIFGG
jgi:sodium transport system permease protein